MLTAEIFSQALSVEKAMYRSLTELEELTGELSQAFSRGDKVSIQMFLSMRQEPLEHLTKQKAALRRLCAGLSQVDAQLLKGILEQPSPPACPGSQELAQQVSRTRVLWERVVRADRQISLKLGGSSSFYAKQP